MVFHNTIIRKRCPFCDEIIDLISDEGEQTCYCGRLRLRGRDYRGTNIDELIEEIINEIYEERNKIEMPTPRSGAGIQIENFPECKPERYFLTEENNEQV